MDSHGCSLRVLGAIMDSYGCVLRVLGGMCGLSWMCSQGVWWDVWIAMDVFSVY